MIMRLKAECWSEPLRVDKKLSNADSWREVHEEDQAAIGSGQKLKNCIVLSFSYDT